MGNNLGQEKKYGLAYNIIGNQQMKFQDPSMRGSSDVGGMKSVTDRQNDRHTEKSIGPLNFFLKLGA